MTTQRHPNIVNLKDIETTTEERGTRFGHRRKRLAFQTGAKSIGCSWYEVPPGKQAFPHHFHCANEEAFFILSGKGDFRMGGQTFSVSAGDYLACPPGPDGSHSITNTGTEPLTYLAMSTLIPTDVVVYPDSKKFGVIASENPKAGFRGAWFAKLLKDQPNVDYYLDEEK